MYNPTTRQFDAVVENTGHWGNRVYPGCGPRPPRRHQQQAPGAGAVQHAVRRRRQERHADWKLNGKMRSEAEPRRIVLDFIDAQTRACTVCFCVSNSSVAPLTMRVLVLYFNISVSRLSLPMYFLPVRVYKGDHHCFPTVARAPKCPWRGARAPLLRRVAGGARAATPWWMGARPGI